MPRITLRQSYHTPPTFTLGLSCATEKDRTPALAGGQPVQDPTYLADGRVCVALAYRKHPTWPNCLPLDEAVSVLKARLSYMTEACQLHDQDYQRGCYSACNWR